MRPHAIFMIAACVLAMTASTAPAQTGFTAEEYAAFLKANTDLPEKTLLTRHSPKQPYFKDLHGGSLYGVSYLDSVMLKYKLTDPEISLLANNQFVVTERNSHQSFGFALYDVYNNDLPVFISTDAVLQSLHASYDRILQHLEIDILEPNLSKALDALDAAMPTLIERYGGNPKMIAALDDADLYVTMARSLLADQKLPPRRVSASTFDTVWNAIQSQKMSYLPLFSERIRKIDCSQFIVRGHYTQDTGGKPLGPYFKCMMWLGRIDFLLTPPPAADEAPWSREEIRRMNLGAALVHELLELSGSRALFDENDRIIARMVGESDNLTTGEFASVLASRSITRADTLLDDATYDAYYAALVAAPGSGQKILSDYFVMNPYSATPDTLPVSFKLMGQRFIIDSYVFSNLVYDRIVYQGEKIWRPMPDPLDALFVLGNDDALPILESELAKYHYSTQLASLRYLVDAYDDTFWDESLYNAWLGAVRQLNPPADQSKFPMFMRTAAWRQEKMNTQLASWAQLRHDTLLYAKQSYTGGISCSFPHSYVEPYPEFYKQIGRFAENAAAFFGTYPSQGRMAQIQKYFPKLETLMERLETIARKELAREALSADEAAFLQGMMVKSGMGCGPPPFTGWYSDLFYYNDDVSKTDYVIADVHTQSTDEFGNVVGKVLHVGTGKVNLGVFIAECPTAGNALMAFIGPVMSYHEMVTKNFDRYTDERWTKLIADGSAPARPDWVNIYLADQDGNRMTEGRELPALLPTGVEDTDVAKPEVFPISISPNPFNPAASIRYTVQSNGRTVVAIYDILGRKAAVLADGYRRAGVYESVWNADGFASGIYFCRLETGGRSWTAKMTLIR